MRHIQMNIHGLRKLTDMYGYGCEVTDIHGYPDVTAPISLLQPKGWLWLSKLSGQAVSQSQAKAGAWLWLV
jgi:hypothetical protein